MAGYRRFDKCKSCGAVITWITMLTGKAMPCDATPVCIVVDQIDGPHHDASYITEIVSKPSNRPIGIVVHGRIATTDNTNDARETAWVSHFSTCPNAAQHRRDGHAD